MILSDFYESDDAITARGTSGKFLKTRPMVDPRHVSEIVVDGTLDSQPEPETAPHSLQYKELQAYSKKAHIKRIVYPLSDGWARIHFVYIVTNRNMQYGNQLFHPYHDDE